MSIRLDRSAPTFVAGHRGLVGSAIVEHLRGAEFRALLTRSRAELDLRDPGATDAFFAREKPRYVFLAAAKVGGILANDTYPVDFLRDNLLIQTNVLDAAHRHGAERLVFLGSSCIYPKHCPQPIREEYLLTGPLEPTNEAYAIAKIAGIKAVQAYRKQYGFRGISLMPTNLYGPRDNFDLTTSHVLPALVRKLSEARRTGQEVVTLWGTGTPRREFLHVEDLARAALYLAEHYDEPDVINVGTGEDVAIAELATMVATATGYGGRIAWDASKPDGTPRKLLDVSRARALGWSPTIGLAQGIASTVAWYEAHRETS
jgi:GDP-L-fucose synthase